MSSEWEKLGGIGHVSGLADVVNGQGSLRPASLNTAWNVVAEMYEEAIIRQTVMPESLLLFGKDRTPHHVLEARADKAVAEMKARRAAERRERELDRLHGPRLRPGRAELNEIVRKIRRREKLRETIRIAGDGKRMGRWVSAAR